MRSSHAERRHASHLRKLLVGNGIKYKHVEKGYKNGGRGELENILKAKVFETCYFFCLL